MDKYKNKIIGLVGMHNVDNYGAILQLFSLFVYLKNFGKPVMINYQNPKFLSYLSVIRYNGLSSYKSVLKDLIRLTSRVIFIYKLKKFLKNNFNFTKKINEREFNTKKFLKKFSCLFVGSDQVWNPDITSDKNQLNKVYFLNTKIKIPKFSYSSSFGGKFFNKYQIKKINKYLSSFKKISIRESKSLRLINKANQLKTNHSCDPVFLHTKTFWNILAKKTKPNFNYILVYSVARSKLIKKVTTSLKKKTNYKIITIDNNLIANTNYDYKIASAGIEDFLYYFKNAKFVVTDSFHGVCFSLIWKKKFISVVSNNYYGFRINNLLNRISCQKNIFRYADKINDLKYYKISNLSIKKMEYFKKKSENYLKSCFNN